MCVSLKDLEAQRDAIPPVVNTSSSSSVPPAPARAGRGGAGNFTDTSSAAAQREQAVADDTHAAMQRQQQQQHSTKLNAHNMSGRGGAGNWKHSHHIDTDDDEGNRNGAGGPSFEQQVSDAVDMHLKMPEKAHRAAAKLKDQI